MSKKKQLGNRFEEYTSEKPETFGNRDYDDDVFAALDSAQVSTDTLPIMSIMADITQPRRIVPRDIRGSWGGHPKAWPNLIQRWEEYIFDAGYELPILEILRGKENHLNYIDDKSEPIVTKFVELLGLAGHIHDIGLQQRIGVKPKGKEYVIIYGERRWSAFHLLNYYLGDDYASIPARIAHVSEWELAKIQAAENFHHVELNAISKARQFAKLIMIANAEQGNYDSWVALVNGGGCDRPYYAQVADGNLHPIPYGMGTQFEQTLGISPAQMRQYRKLLKLTGDYDLDNYLWDMGDIYDWSENFMREVGQHLSPDSIKNIIETVTGRNASPDAEAETDGEMTVEEALREAIGAAKAAKPKRVGTRNGVSDDDDFSYLDKHVRLDDGKIGTVWAEDKNGDLTIELYPSNKNHHTTTDHVLSILNEAAYKALTTPSDDDADVETNWPSQAWVGKWAYAGKEKVWVREATLPETVIVTLSKSGEDIAMHLSTLTFDPPSEETAGSDWSATIGGGTVKAGDTVLVNTSSGTKSAIVVGPSNLKSQVDVQFEDGHVQPYYKSTLSLVSDDEPNSEGDNSILDKRVQLDDGTTGIVSHVDGHNIRIIRDDNGRTLYTMDGYIVSILDEEEIDEGSDNTDSDTPSTAAQWVGKPALYMLGGNGIPVVVAGTTGVDAVIVQTGDGERVQVNIDELQPAPDLPGQTLTEYYDKPSTSKPSSNGAGSSSDKTAKQLAIPYGENVRLIISALSGLAEAMSDPGIKHKLQSLNDLTMKQTHQLAADSKLQDYLTDADGAIQAVVDFILVETGDALNTIADSVPTTN